MIAASCIAFAGCGGPATHSDSIAAHLSAGAPTKTQDSVNKMMSALEQKLPAGTRVFQTDSIVVHAGDNFAQFAAASRVTRSASSVTVVDAESAQTFTFPADASVEHVTATTSAYVAPGHAVPAWVAQSHGHVARVL
jgi:hypothetical protein